MAWCFDNHVYFSAFAAASVGIAEEQLWRWNIRRLFLIHLRRFCVLLCGESGLGPHALGVTRALNILGKRYSVQARWHHLTKRFSEKAENRPVVGWHHGCDRYLRAPMRLYRSSHAGMAK